MNNKVKTCGKCKNFFPVKVLRNNNNDTIAQLGSCEFCKETLIDAVEYAENCFHFLPNDN